jgi:uncharacterized protein YaiI (UPF0178 family)
MLSKKKTTLAALAGIALAGVALYLALGDRLPIAALAGAADNSSAVQGMIGKATYAQQQKLEPMLAQLEAEESPDEALLEQARKQKQAIDKDLQLALNLIHAGSSGPNDSGWYYSAWNLQESMARRLDAVAAKLAPAAASPEEGSEPAEADSGDTQPAPSQE